MKGYIESVFGLVVGVMLFGMFIVLFLKAVEKQEVAECGKWKQEAAVIVGFYLTDWQKAQCQAHNIIIK